MTKLTTFKDLKVGDYIIVVYFIPSEDYFVINFGKVAKLNIAEKSKIISYFILAETKIKNNILIGFKYKKSTNRMFAHSEYTDVYVSKVFSIPIIEGLMKKYLQNGEN